MIGWYGRRYKMLVPLNGWVSANYQDMMYLNMTLAAAYLVLTLVLVIICGIIAKNVLVKKGYDENYFWIGYLFSPMLLLAAMFLKKKEEHAVVTGHS